MLTQSRRYSRNKSSFSDDFVTEVDGLGSGSVTQNFNSKLKHEGFKIKVKMSSS